jgi:hypothetical protein
MESLSDGDPSWSSAHFNNHISHPVSMHASTTAFTLNFLHFSQSLYYLMILIIWFLLLEIPLASQLPTEILRSRSWSPF